MNDIKSLRKAAGMTQREFAEYFNIPLRTLQGWESGRFAPPPYLVPLLEYKLKTEDLIKSANL